MKLQRLAINKYASHGFSTQLIDDVVKNCDGIFTIGDVLTNYPVFSVGSTIRILGVIQELFLDIPSLEDTLTLFNLKSHFTHDTWFNFKDITLSDNDDGYQVQDTKDCQFPKNMFERLQHAFPSSSCPKRKLILFQEQPQTSVSA